MIKKAKEEKKEFLSLKIGVPFTGHVTRYQYESTGDVPLEVLRRVMESPYVYSVPAQVRERGGRGGKEGERGGKEREGKLIETERAFKLIF